MVEAAADSGGAGGVSTEAPRRSERLLQGKKRSRYASPAPARRRQATKRSHAPSQGKHDQEIVGGSADDAEAEFTSASLVYLTEEEIVSRYKRLYNKRANMGLAWYNKNNPEGQYEFTSVVLNDICEFMDGGVCYTHMNFKARNVNVTTRSEELFFAELALTNDVFDTNSGYATTVCSIVDGNCVGGKKGSYLQGGRPAERFDGKNCYACVEKIKHPPGVTYKGGHYVEDYMAGSDSE